jgi:hypothetical protein
MGNDLSKQVKDWLSKQGYPLELEVARAFFAVGGLSVSISDIYKDYDTGESREIDVTVCKFHRRIRELSLRVCCRIECKTSKDKPWVVFVSDVQPNALSVLSLLCDSTYRGFLSHRLLDDDDTRAAITANRLLNPTRLGHGITQALKGEKAADVSYQAVMGAVKAAIDYVRFVEQISPTRSLSTLECCAVLPIIVIDTPLFECGLDAQNEIEVREVASSVLYWQLTNPLEISPFVHIVTKVGLGQFIADFQTTATELIGLTAPHASMLINMAEAKQKLVTPAIS